MRMAAHGPIRSPETRPPSALLPSMTATAPHCAALPACGDAAHRRFLEHERSVRGALPLYVDGGNDMTESRVKDPANGLASARLAAPPVRANILIIDDDEGTRETYARALRSHGFEVSTVATGREGVASATTHTFDVVLVDLRLPDISGLDVVRTLSRYAILLEY